MRGALAAAALAGALLLASCHGRTPALGSTGGRLAACPSSPNCVSSQGADARHAIAPLVTGGGDCAGAMDRLAAVIAAEPRARVVTHEAGYVRAEFTSRLFRFVDDLEAVCDPATGRVDVRSASRLGESDLGVNRARVERLRAALAAAR